MENNPAEYLRVFAFLCINLHTRAEQNAERKPGSSDAGYYLADSSSHHCVPVDKTINNIEKNAKYWIKHCQQNDITWKL